MSTEAKNQTEKTIHTLRSFGRRNGRPLRDGQSRLWDEVLPSVKFDVANMQWAAGKPLWLEIGFGGGEHLAALADKNPEVAFIGCEPFRNGVVKLLGAIEVQKLTNVRVHADDARQVLRALPEGSLARAYVLYPDPWPKLRHQKRRLVNKELLDLFARALPKGGIVQLATDHEGYGQWMLEHFLADSRWRWTAESMNDWEKPPEGWVPTRYEIKCLEETPPVYLRFERV
jgi:tRNA (guanine-N7-)-methyltransferase